MVTLYKPTAEFIRQMRKAGQMPQFSTLSPIGADLLVAEWVPRMPTASASPRSCPTLERHCRSSRNTTRPLQAFAKHSNYSYYGIEGFINAKLMAEALRKAGRDLSREKLVTTLESTPFDLGGYKINYSPTSHNGSRFVDLTVLGRDGRVLR
jgi:hypothetical protein